MITTLIIRIFTKLKIYFIMTEQEVIQFITNQRIRMVHLTTLFKNIPEILKHKSSDLALVNCEKGTLYLERILKELGLTLGTPTITKPKKLIGDTLNALQTQGAVLEGLEAVIQDAENEAIQFATQIIPSIPNLYNNNKFVVDCMVAESYRAIVEVSMYMDIYRVYIDDLTDGGTSFPGSEPVNTN